MKQKQPETDPSEMAELIRLAKLLVEGKLPPEIKEGSEFYELLQEIAKQKLGLVPISELFGKKE